MLKTKKNTGITLIALIITIVVLLILAGITINAITGSENAMEKAKQAREENEVANELEQIKLAVINAMAEGLDGLVSKVNLETALSGLIKGEIEDYEEGGWIVEGPSGTKYIITASGQVAAKNEIVIAATSNEILQGGTTTISITKISDNLANKTITWESSDTSKATIVGNGNTATVTAVAVGTTNITATAGGKISNECTVNVVKKMSSVEGLKASGKVGSEITITLPENTESITSYELLTGASTYVEIKNSKLYGKAVTPSGTVAEVKVIGNSETYTTVEVTVGENMPRIGTPVEATKDKYGYWVERKVFNQDGTVQQENGEDKYQDYQAAISTTGGWRLFYQDSENTYIISENLISSTAPNVNYDSYNGSNLSSEGKGLNYDVKSYLTNSSYSFTGNVRATSWFTDTSETSPWNTYKGPDADYAIASPTAELFVKSFNTSADVYNVGKTEDQQMKKIGVTVGPYGYDRKMANLTDNMEQNVLKTTYNKGIYLKDTNWWLASPSSYGTDYSWSNTCPLVYASTGRFGNANVGTANSVRPLVSIPTSTFNINFRLVSNK